MELPNWRGLEFGLGFVSIFRQFVVYLFGPWSDIPGNFSSLAPHTRVSKVADRTGKQRKVFRNIELIDLLPLPTPYQGKFSEAREVLEAAARRNGVTLSEHLLSPDPGSDSKRAAVDEK